MSLSHLFWAVELCTFFLWSKLTKNFTRDLSNNPLSRKMKESVKRSEALENKYQLFRNRKSFRTQIAYDLRTQWRQAHSRREAGTQHPALLRWHLTYLFSQLTPALKERINGAELELTQAEKSSRHKRFWTRLVIILLLFLMSLPLSFILSFVSIIIVLTLESTLVVTILKLFPFEQSTVFYSSLLSSIISMVSEETSGPDIGIFPFFLSLCISLYIAIINSKICNLRSLVTTVSY